MSSHLTYRPREGIVFGVVAGRPIRLATLRNPSGIALEAWRAAARAGGAAAGPRNVTHWEHQYEFPPVRVPARAPGQRLTIADNAAFEVFDHPGAYAQRFDGIDPGGGQADHRHHAQVVWVKSASRQSVPIHGSPACGDPRCIVIVQGWESLFAALKATRQVSIVVEL